MTAFILFVLSILFTSNQDLTPTTEIDSVGYTTSCEEEVEEKNEHTTYNVTATIYYPTGNPTASGQIINSQYRMQTHRWCALSRDLLARWGGEFEYGDTIVVEGINNDVDGIFIVHDATHQRFNNRIDILIRPSNPLYDKWHDVTIRKYDNTRDNSL